MNRIKDFVFSLLTSGKYTGMQDEKDMDAMLRLIVLNSTYSVASICIIVMGVADMRAGNTDNGLIQLVIGFLIFLNLFLLRTEFPFMVGGLVLTGIFGAYCWLSVFAKDDMHGFAALWIYLYPLMSIFTLSLPIGLIPTLLLFVGALVGTFTPGLAGFDYTVTEASLICGLYFFVTALTVVYEYVRSVKDRWLSRQDSYMNMVFKSSQDIILLLDRNDKLIYCADIFLKRIHVRNFDVIRKKDYREVFAHFVKPEKLREIVDIFQASTGQKKPAVFERTLNMGEGGKSLHYEIHYTPMYNDADVFQGAFIFFHDMTEMIETQERLEQASLAKSNFLANMSHEIRTPLNAIIGMTAIAKGTAEKERKDYCLEKIEGASTHLLGIINDILDMSKIEEGKLELSCTEMDFAAMLQRVVNIFEFRLSERNQRFTLNTDSRIPAHIISDEQRLAQVITNLIGNAVKFTPEGGKISLETRRTDSGDDASLCELEFRVTDTGPGISKEQQGRLFQSFVQVDSSISRKFGGTGLGLAISKKIVEMMKGNIRIESETGRGSTFIFTIKAEVPRQFFAPAEVSGGVKTTAVENADSSPDSVFDGKRILLAEDVDINREIVIAVLEPTGIAITEVEDGRQAFDIFSANPEDFDLIFMDIHMPGIDGYEATRLIRALAHPKAKTIPIIAMTANIFREDVENCYAAGMNDHLGKPLNFNEVTRVLEKYLCDSAG